MQKQANIKIYGEVHGVFFRRQAQKVAQGLGLTGFARNEPDGTVYIIAEGAEADLGKLIEWCKEGPELAHVLKVEVMWHEPEGKFKEFQIS